MLHGIPTVEAQRKLAVSMAEKGSVTVKWVPKLKSPVAYRNGEKAEIFLKVPSLLNIKQWEMEAHHEISHLLPELKFTYAIQSGARGKLNNAEETVANILCDNLCERARHGDYLGRDLILLEGRREYMKRHPRMILERDNPGTSALMQWDVENRKRWQGNLPEVETMPGAEHIVGQLDKIKLNKQLDHLLKTQDADAFRELIKQVTRICYSPEMAGAKPDSDGEKADGEGQSGEPQEGQSGEGQSGEPKEGQPKEGQSGEGQPGKGSPKPGGPDGTKGVRKDMKETADGSKTSAPPSSGEGSHSAESKGESKKDAGESKDKADTKDKSDTKKAGRSEPKKDKGSEDKDAEGKDSVPDIKKVDLPPEVKPLTTEKPMSEHDMPRGSERYNPFKNKRDIIPNYNVRDWVLQDIKTRAEQSTVSKRIKRYLKIVSKDHYNYGQAKGKLHSKNVYRITTGQDNPRVFKTKDRSHLKTDTAISLLLDCSGSMNRNNRYLTGAACCVAISQTLNDLRIVHEILGYSEYRELWTYIFKTFAQSMTKDKLLRGFASSNIVLDENADGESVLYAVERLAMRKEKHKILIVMSDGSPAGTYDGDGNWYLKKVCEAIEASSIDLLGIGIQTDSVKRFYKHHTVINRMEDLDTVLFNALKKQLT